MTPAWRDLDRQLRQRTLRFLRSRLTLDDQDALRIEITRGCDWAARYPGWGTEVCDLLRANIAADEDLPGEGWREYWADAVAEAVSSFPGFM